MTEKYSKFNWGYVIANNSWINDFSESFDSQDIRIYREVEDNQYDYYVWSSIHLNEFTDERKIYERASALSALFDGAMYLFVGADYYPFWRGDVIFLENGSKIGNIEANPLVEPFWQEYVDTTKKQPEDLVARVIHKSRSDLKLREILLFLGVNKLSWISLYAVLDTIKSEGWNEKKIIEEKVATEVELNLFGQTVNNPAAIGPFARHGTKRGWNPPANPMPHATAKKLILEIVKAFVLERI